MPYRYQQIDARFFLPRRHHAAALARIHRMCGASESERVPGLTTLSEAFRTLHCFTWNVDMDLDGNITNLDLQYGSHWRYESTAQLFVAIAPFVAAGSYIHIRGEEGEEWRWEFDGQQLHTIADDGKKLGNTIYTSADYRLEPPTDYNILNLDKNQVRGCLRSRAVEILGTLGEAAPLPLLIDLLNDAGGAGLQAQVALKPLSRQVPLAVIEQLVNADDGRAWHISMEILLKRGDEEALDMLVARMRQGRDGRLFLYKFGQNDALPVEKLIPLLEDENGHVRRMALQLLGQRTPLASLLRALQDRHNEGEATTAPRVALQILLNSEESLPPDPFIALLNHPDSYVRHLVASLLKKQGQRVPLKALVRALESTDDAFLRGLLIEALDAFGEQAPLAQIMETLLNQDVYFTVIRTLDGYSYGREPISLPGISPYLPVARLRHLALHADEMMRWRALHLCGRMGAYAPVDLLREIALHEEESRDIRYAAIEALSMLGEHAPLDVLLSLVDEAAPRLRFLAIQGLRTMGARVPLTVWSKLAQHFDRGVRREAIAALKGSDHPLAIAVLLSALSDASAENREAAVSGLASVVEQIPVKRMISLLYTSSAWQRTAVLQVAAMLGERLPLAALEKAYTYLAGKVAALGQTDDTPIDLLWEVESDWLAPLRFAIIRRQGADAPIEPVLAALGDWRSSTYDQALKMLPAHPEAQRLMVAEAEALLRTGSVGRHLGSLVQSYHMARLDTAQSLTGQLWHDLAEALDWHYWPVRVEALRALKRIPHTLPQSILKRVLALQHDPASAVVRLAARETCKARLVAEPGPEDLSS